jgi:RimJ/RimL family protein N-acetyltransferase
LRHDLHIASLASLVSGQRRDLRPGGVVIFRPIGEPDMERVLPVIVPDPASSLTATTYRARLKSGEYRREWTWIAEDSAADDPGGSPRVAAAAIWWGRPGEAHPSALDGVFVPGSPGPADQGDRAGLAAGLLSAAHRAYASTGLADLPDYHIFLPRDWRDRPDVVAALAWREQAARQAGLTARLERLRYEWTPQAGLPDPPGRLIFRPEPDDEVFVQLLRRVLAGTLDATSRREADAIGAEAQARQDTAFYREKMLGERNWWRIAGTPDGEVVGFGIPARNTDFAVVGYLGVLPEHRGHGYVDDILAEITRLLAAEDAATVIRADTDLANRPMAAAFDRAGYRNFSRRLVLSGPLARAPAG